MYENEHKWNSKKTYFGALKSVLKAYGLLNYWKDLFRFIEVEGLDQSQFIVVLPTSEYHVGFLYIIR